MKQEYGFDEPGSLKRPGWIGRLVRLALSSLCGLAIYGIVTEYQLFFTGPMNDIMLWVLVLLALHLLPPVVNIGFGKIWHSKPQMWYVLIFYIFSVVAGNIENTFWPTFSGYALIALPAYVFTHLGLSFLLASILATPGCEMRSIPHLYTLLTGKKTREHFCPGFLDGVDKWEQRRLGR